MFRGNFQAYQPATTQKVDYTGTSAATSNAVATGIHLVRVVSTTDCHVAIGGTPTATTSDLYLPAYTVEYFIVNEGQKLAAIRAASSGSLYVTEMTK